MASRVDLVVVFRDTRRRSGWMDQFISGCRERGVPVDVVRVNPPQPTHRRLTTSQRSLLARLSSTDETGTAHLARAAGRDVREVRRSLRRLEARGLVRRGEKGWLRSNHKREKRGGMMDEYAHERVGR
jgi:hypothetical protein